MSGAFSSGVSPNPSISSLEPGGAGVVKSTDTDLSFTAQERPLGGVFSNEQNLQVAECQGLSHCEETALLKCGYF